MKTNKKAILFRPGQTVRILEGQLSGLTAVVVSHPFQGKIVLRVQHGVYLEVDDNGLRIDESDLPRRDTDQSD